MQDKLYVNEDFNEEIEFDDEDNMDEEEYWKFIEEHEGELYDFEKHNPDDQIWWSSRVGILDSWVFSFDKKTIFKLFGDYPSSLTKEQKEIFDKENPFWAEFFNGGE